MSRVWQDGAEFGDILFWDVSATVSASTTQKRTGGYSYAISGGGYAAKNVSDPVSFYIRFGFYLVGVSTGRLFTWYHGLTELGSIRVDSTTNLFYAYVGTTLVATGTHAFALSAWNLVELYVNINDAGDIELKFNGVLDIDYAGDTKPGTDAHCDVWRYQSPSGGSTYFDDMAYDNAAWCGDGHIELLTPNGNGDTNNWTGSDGDSVNNYLLVDDIPPNSDTDYVKSNTALQQDFYDLTDFTGTGKIITNVWAECRAKDNDATSGQIKIGVHIGATTSLSAALTLSGAYARYVGTLLATNPDDAAAWEDADLDAVQFVAECE